MKATEVTAGPAESNGSLLPGIWSDSLHVTCGLTACTPGSAPGPTLGNEYEKTLPNVVSVSVAVWDGCLSDAGRGDDVGRSSERVGERDDRQLCVCTVRVVGRLRRRQRTGTAQPSMNNACSQRMNSAHRCSSRTPVPTATLECACSELTEH